MNAGTRRVRTMLYGSVGAGVALLFFLLLWEPMKGAVAEGDLAWMIPAVLVRGEGMTFLELLRLIFSSDPPKVASAFVTGNLLVVLWALGLHTRHLVLGGMLLHGLNAVLLYGLTRQMQFSKQVGFLSALVYFTLFTHFHAYLWPTATALHLSPLFLVLMTLNLFFRAERVGARARFGPVLYGLTLGAAVVASVGRASIIAFLLILADILGGSANNREARLRYERWFPLFLLSALYPFYTLVFSGEWHSNTFLHVWMNALGRSALAGPVKLLGLFVVWAGFLAGLAVWLRFCERRGVSAWRFLWVAAAAGIAFLASFDRRQILFPYNALAPLAIMFRSFLDPLRSAMSMDSSFPFYFMQPQMEVFTVLLTVGAVFLFFRTAVRENRHRRILVWWYLFSLLQFLFEFSSQPVLAPSRHYVWISPVFSVLLASVGVLLIGGLWGPLRLVGIRRDLLVLGLFLGLCLPNLLSVRLAVWRGKLTNNFYTYDDIRTAHLIQEDWAEEGGGIPQQIVVSGVVPMPYDETYWPFMQVDPEKHWMFRFVTEEVLSRRGLRERIRVLPGSGGSGLAPAVDPFRRMTDQAAAHMAAGDLGAARDLLLKALKRRPFLFRYLLPEGCRFSDLRWLTHGSGLREWVDRVSHGWGKPDHVIAKQFHTRRLLQEEVFDYLRALFYLSYIEEQEGHPELSRAWLSQIWFLEPDRERLVEWVSRAQEVRSNPALLGFAQNIRDPKCFGDPLPWRKDDYGLGRFVIRFMSGLDLRSKWDR